MSQHSSLRRHAAPWRILGIILWPAFVVAAAATLVFFTLVDPLALAAISWPSLGLSRLGGYTLGFFMFWAVAGLSGALSCVLLRPAPQPPGRLDEEELD